MAQFGVTTARKSPILPILQEVCAMDVTAAAVLARLHLYINRYKCGDKSPVRRFSLPAKLQLNNIGQELHFLVLQVSSHMLKL